MYKDKIAGQDKKGRLEKVVKVLLVNRGLKTKKQKEDFLRPKKPLKISYQEAGVEGRELRKAVKRVKKAVERNEGVLVYGDYDADGICSTALVWEALHEVGAKAWPFIPHRQKHGYGLRIKGLKDVSDESKKYFGGREIGLVVAVDNGIVANSAVDYLRRRGVETVIVDHHEPGRNLPKATAIVHTKKLAGSGLAWFLARELLSLSSEQRASDWLDLVAVGTICDLVPLLGVNRSLVKYGLEELSRTKRAGLKALFRQAGMRKSTPGVDAAWRVGPYEVGYVIGPRLNAMGRLKYGLDSLRLLCTRNEGRAAELAEVLGKTNIERQRMTEESSLHAQDSLTREETRLLFVGHESYHQGVIGLIASDLVEKFNRPAIVFAKGERYSKASARSIRGFNIIEAIREAGEGLLAEAGGHAMAAGFTVETRHLEVLRKRIQKVAEERIEPEFLKKTLRIDCGVDLDDLSWALYDKVKLFEPFGVGNPEPVFVSRGVKVLEVRTVGAEKRHLKLVLPRGRNGGTIEAIGFGMGGKDDESARTAKLDLAYSLAANEWDGQKKLELRLRDVKLL